MLNLTRINEWGKGDMKLDMINNNSINIIYTEKNNISIKFDKNEESLSELKEKVSINNNLIGDNFTSILAINSNYVIDNIWLFNLDFIKDINFTSNINKILIYENDIRNGFKVGSYIQLDESNLYLYDNIENFYFISKETYQFLEQNDIILEEFSFNITSKGAILRNCHIYKNAHYYKISSYITNLKVRLYLERINEENNMEFNLRLTNEFQNNFICLKYFRYTR